MASAGKYTLEIETQYTGLTVRPGDKLVVAVSAKADMKTIDDVTRSIESRLPGVDVIVITEAIGLAVYRSEGSEM